MIRELQPNHALLYHFQHNLRQKLCIVSHLPAWYIADFVFYQNPISACMCQLNSRVSFGSVPTGLKSCRQFRTANQRLALLVSCWYCNKHLPYDRPASNSNCVEARNRGMIPAAAVLFQADTCAYSDEIPSYQMHMWCWPVHLTMDTMYCGCCFVRCS